MTEQEWLASDDPSAMLECLAKQGALWWWPKYPSERKLRLFACACWRQHHWLNVKMSHSELRVVESVEAWADGKLKDRPTNRGYWLGTQVLFTDGDNAAQRWATMPNGSEIPEMPSRAALLRDVAGNPFRHAKWSSCSLCEGTGWCTKVDHDNPGSHLHRPCKKCGPSADAVRLARAAYEERKRKCVECATTWKPLLSPCAWCGSTDGTGLANYGTLDPVRLAVLADALEEAGYLDDAPCPHNCYELYGCRWRNGQQKCDCVAGKVPNSVLTHLREPGPHVRGCWVVDFVLGKE